MGFTLDAAILGALAGSAILSLVTLYARPLSSQPKALGLWAIAFLLQTASYAVLLISSLGPQRLWAADALHGGMAMLVLAGAMLYLRRRFALRWLLFGLILAMLWALAADMLRHSGEHPDLPLFGLGGLPLLVAAAVFLLADQRRVPGHLLAAAAFGLSGVAELTAPLLYLSADLAPLSFILAQISSILTAFALLVVVLRRQQGAATIASREALRLHQQFVDAIESISEGFVLFGADGRLVMSNRKYRQLMAPVADHIRPGVALDDLMRLSAERRMMTAALGREEEWIAEQLDRRREQTGPHDHELTSGRWLSIGQYRTRDGGNVAILTDITGRRQAEQALRQSESRLRGIMNVVVDGIITIDQHGLIQSFNPSAEQIFGYQAAEVVGCNVSLLMPEPMRSSHDGYMQAYETTRTPQIIGSGRQVQGLCKNGRLVALDLSVAELVQPSSVLYIGVVRDITERVRTQEALQTSEQRFRDMAEATSDWFWELGSDHRVKFVSGRGRGPMDLEPSALVGLDLSTLFGPSATPLIEQIEARKPFRNHSASFRLPGGALRHLRLSGRPVVDRCHLFHGYRGTATDVTAEVEANAQAEQARSQLMAALQSITEGFALWDIQDRLVLCNAKFHEFYPPGTVIAPGMTFAELSYRLAESGRIPGDRRQVARWRRDYQALHDAAAGGMEMALSGDIWLLVNKRRSADGSVVGIYTDITLLKRREREEARQTELLREAKDAAEHANRAKAAFLANISHELRTPLNAVIGFSEAILEELFGPIANDRYQGYLRDIHGSGLHLLDLINDILDMSKAEANHIELHEESVEIAELVEQCLRLTSQRASLSDILLIPRLSPSLPRLRGDRRRLKQVLLNLLSNAIKFTEEDGHITIRAWHDADGFFIEVADNGIGIAPEDLPRVMEPFIQADNRLSRRFEGTGLGLPLTKALIMAHGGDMTLESIPNQGTTVRVMLPLSRVELVAVS